MSEAICSWSWWHLQMETFSALLALCAGSSKVTGEFPSQRPVRRSFDVIFDLRLKAVELKLRRRWFETPSRLLWRHCNYLRVLLENTAKKAHSFIIISWKTHLRQGLFTFDSLIQYSWHQVDCLSDLKEWNVISSFHRYFQPADKSALRPPLWQSKISARYSQSLLTMNTDGTHVRAR